MSMWLPFTERARWAIILAQQAAQRHGSQSIEPDHIFVGIVEEGGSAAAEAVSSFGVSALDVRVAAQKRMETGSAAGEMVFSSGAKRVIELAFEESQRLQHAYVGTEHLLLGYLRERESQDSLLAHLQINAASLKAKVLEFLDQEPKVSTPSSHAPVMSRPDSFGLLFADIERLDSPGLRSAIEHESRRRLYYIDTEELWKRLQGAAARRDVIGSLMYALFIGRRENRTADETIRELRSRIGENYGR